MKIIRIHKLTLAIVMATAIEKIGGSPSVSDVAYWIIRKYGYRWSTKSIQSYFSSMSRPQVFQRTKRGHYQNIGVSMKKGKTA